MQANALRVLLLEAVVESLVVTEIESLLLQLPLQVPVRLRDEDEAPSSVHSAPSPARCADTSLRTRAPPREKSCAINRLSRACSTWTSDTWKLLPPSR